MRIPRSLVAIVAALVFTAAPFVAQGQAATSHTSTSAATSEQNWWKNAVFYEIYPRSFQDSNGDGIGDLNGITSRLDYLKSLGINAIWLTPIYPSPQVDFGYDISDYEAIDPQYGTMADFDHLIAEANKRHIRVLMDMVMNHTSDQHQWFIQSRSSRNNPYRDWYMWHDGKGETATSKGEPPNNWQSLFGHSAWQWDPKTRQYYYHRFYIQQPDLNWNNPKVRQAFKDILAFWLKRGVGGFRFDAITALFEDPQLRNDDVVKDKNGKPIINAFGDSQLDSKFTDNLPEVHDVMAEMRAFTNTFDSNHFPGSRVLIGETYLPNIAELRKQYGSAANPEFQLPMDTQIGFINKLDVATFRNRIDDAETKLDGQVPLIVFDNHDNPRIDARYGDGVHNTAIERVIATILFASRGASLFYNGDEIGMKTTPPTRKQDVKDPVGITGWPKNKGRDGERTPMQWSDAPNAGFSSPGVKTWLPIPPSYTTVNVAAEEHNKNSMLDWYKTLIHLKQSVPALEIGKETMLATSSNTVLSWQRTAPGEPAVVVAVNFTASPQKVDLSAAGSKAETLLKSPEGVDPASLQHVELKPFGVYIGQVKP
ncbi:MAG: alpha-glucosidase [Acidobacteriota bacterium]|nr:alpha-glucosidase [Acidobacteriota bacterium]